MEKCISLLEEAKSELENVEGSEEAIATIEQAIAETKELYGGDENSLEKEEKNMLDSGDYKRGSKSGVLIEIGFGKGKGK